MMSYSSLLNEYQEFFTEMYYSGLFFVEVYTQALSYGYREEYCQLYDKYLNYALTCTPGIYNYARGHILPDKSLFNVNIFINYPAYKLMNLNYCLQNGIIQDFQFSGYKDHDDKNIEELLFESDHLRQLISSLKVSFLDNIGLSYKAFSKLKINNEYIKGYQEFLRNEELMGNKINRVL